MARGFFFRLTTHGPDDLTVERATQTAHDLGQRLSEVEHRFLGAAVDAAKAIVGSLGGHPATVTFEGKDSLTVPDEDTAVSVTVSTPAMAKSEAPAPAPVTVVMSSKAPAEAPVAAESTEVASGETDSVQA